MNLEELDLPLKISLPTVKQSKLEDYQKELIHEFLTKLGCFEYNDLGDYVPAITDADIENTKLSPQVLCNRFEEDVIWNIIFTDYNPRDENHTRKLYNVMRMFINWCLESKKGNIGRNKPNGHHGQALICIPSEQTAKTQFNRNINTSITVGSKAIVINFENGLNKNVGGELVQGLIKKSRNGDERLSIGTSLVGGLKENILLSAGMNHILDDEAIEEIPQNVLDNWAKLQEDMGIINATIENIKSRSLDYKQTKQLEE